MRLRAILFHSRLNKIRLLHRDNVMLFADAMVAGMIHPFGLSKHFRHAA